MAEMTKNEFITAKMAEGFTKEAAEHAYDHIYDPTVEASQEQKIPSRGEMISMIEDARQNNLDKNKQYRPDFSLCDAVIKIKGEIEVLKGKVPYDSKKAQELSKQALAIKVNGTVTHEMRQAEIDKTLEMPLSELFAQYKKYGKVVAECEEKIETFDVSGVQTKVDALTSKYGSKVKNRGPFMQTLTINAEYNKEVARIEFDEITKPLNDLKIKRYEAMEYLRIYEARIKFYVMANKPLIDEEITAAKRDEIRGSLADLVEYMEG